LRNVKKFDFYCYENFLTSTFWKKSKLVLLHIWIATASIRAIKLVSLYPVLDHNYEFSRIIRSHSCGTPHTCD